MKIWFQLYKFYHSPWNNINDPTKDIVYVIIIDENPMTHICIPAYHIPL